MNFEKVEIYRFIILFKVDQINIQDSQQYLGCIAERFVGFTFI